MFIDLNDLEQEFNTQSTLCIIGAGAAGLTLAKKLGDKIKGITLIESGGLKYEHKTQSLYKGKISRIPYFPLEAVRLRYFGGSTNHWGGQSIPMEPFDFEFRSWVKDSGWPIKYEEMAKYLNEAKDICGIPSGTFNWDDWKTISGKGEYPLRTKVFQEALLRFSEPVKKFGEYYHEYIKSSESIRCILNANVLSIHANEDGTSIESVKITTIDKKNNIKINADYFVLACGGIENSRLLLLSNDVQKNGLGNNNDQVGRYFMEHPNFDTGEVIVSDKVMRSPLGRPFFKVNGGQLRVDFKLRNDVQIKEKILNHSAFLVKDDQDQHGMLNKPDFITRVWGKIKSKLLKSQGEWRYRLRVRLEHAPHADSRIVLSDKLDALGQKTAHMQMEFGDLEPKTINLVQQMFAVELGRMDYGRMKIEFDPKKNKDWQKNVGWQYHHTGGTRMSKSPKNGVVDTDCKVHGIDNLFIAGSSIFPSSGHANPTLNLVALTLRLSDKLEDIIVK